MSENRSMVIEGWLKLQENGRYAIVVKKGKQEHKLEIASGECLDIKIFDKWVTVRMEHDGEQYYFYGEESRLYPSKKVYARVP